jgi:hypothetical protein
VGRTLFAADQQRVRSRCTSDLLRLATYDRCDAQLEFFNGFDSALFVHCSTRPRKNKRLTSALANRVSNGFNAFPHLSRNLAPHLTHYLSEHRKEELKIMNHQDSGTIITFLLLLPWLGRASVSTVTLWRERIETQGRKAKQNF